MKRLLQKAKSKAGRDAEPRRSKSSSAAAPIVKEHDDGASSDIRRGTAVPLCPRLAPLPASRRCRADVAARQACKLGRALQPRLVRAPLPSMPATPRPCALRTAHYTLRTAHCALHI